MRHPSYHFFDIQEIKPDGWLKQQLKIQAGGLSGTLSDFWPDICDSAWIGGSADSWERVPYWLDGLIVLAYLLEDETLINTAKKYIDHILAAQSEDGWICPDVERKHYDMWGYILILKVLAVYHRASADPAVLEAARLALRYLDRHIDTYTLFDWGQARWFEALIPIYWVYAQTGEDWLIKLACKLRTQGFDWKALFSDQYPYQLPDEKGRWSQMSHVVNNAMMLKGNALYSLISNDPQDLAFAKTAYDTLMKHHGMVTGVFTGDECLSGLNPAQGTELCAVAELMYSFEHLAAVTGDKHWADLLERVTFNAFPATFTPDMTAHQYVQQVNQPFCAYHPNPHFGTNGPEANLFGVEPNYGCCTANMHQGFPKFAASLYLYGTQTLVVNGYAPSRLETSRFGDMVRLEQQTDYPFGETIRFTLRCDKPTQLTLLLRIPDWAHTFECSLDGTHTDGYYQIARVFEGETTFTLTMPMQATWQRRPNQMYALTRGPLIYALNIPYEMKKQSKPNQPSWLENFEVLPTGPWQYALAHLDASALQFEQRSSGRFPFAPDQPGMRVMVPCRSIRWPVTGSAPDALPDSESADLSEEMLEFIPYGCTMLRMTELPSCAPAAHD